MYYRNHPVNYRDCNVYRKLQRRKAPNTNSNFLHNTIEPNINNNIKASHPLSLISVKDVSNPIKSYARVTSSRAPQYLVPSYITKILTSLINLLIVA